MFLNPQWCPQNSGKRIEQPRAWNSFQTKEDCLRSMWCPDSQPIEAFRLRISRNTLEHSWAWNVRPLCQPHCKWFACTRLVCFLGCSMSRHAYNGPLLQSKDPQFCPLGRTWVFIRASSLYWAATLWLIWAQWQGVRWRPLDSHWSHCDTFLWLPLLRFG